MEEVDAFLQRSNRVALAASAEVATASEPTEAVTFLRGGASLALAAKRKVFPARPRGPAPRAGRERRSGRGGLTAALADDELESTGRAGRRWRSFGILAASPFRFLLDRLLAPTLCKGTASEPCSQSPDPSPPSGAGPTKDVGVVWFRNDLRVHDNEALAEANKRCSAVLPVFCFDEREYGKAEAKFDRSGPYKAAFTREAVAALRKKLGALGSGLAVRTGKPEDVIPRLCAQVGAKVVFCQGEVSRRDQGVERAVERALGGHGGATRAKLQRCWGSATLHHIKDLPFDVESMPSTYASFCNRLGGEAVRSPGRPPRRVKPWPKPARGKTGVAPGRMPTLEDMGMVQPSGRPRGDLHIKTREGARCRGGEDRALAYLRRQRGRYGGMAGMKTLPDKLAPWFSLGCVSVRRVCEEVLGKDRAARAAKGKPEERDFLFELLWRDFFRLSRMKMERAA